MRTTNVPTVLGVCATAMLLASPAEAQFRTLPPTPAYALQNVTVVHADGRQEPGVNIVVRGSFIEAMGPTVEIPGDAQVLEGDSLWVYPGLVDAQGAAEVEFPDIERGDDVRTWDAPRSLEGMLAHRRVVDYLIVGDGAGKEQRASGIVAAGIHPDGALAAGLGATVVYRVNAENPWQVTANESLGLSMSFQSGQGVYPGTLFGVIAYIRQSFEDATRDGLIRQAYRQNPVGLEVPAFDPDYELLRQAMAGRLTVYFEVNSAENIRRALKLSEEFGFTLVIVGGREAWEVADELAQSNVPVLVDGDFPEPDDWEPAEAEGEEPEEGAAEQGTDAEPGMTDPDPEAEAESEGTDPDAEAQEAEEELTPAAAREKERIENIWSNAARLAEAGVTFAITSGGGDADLREAAMKSMEYGLSEDAALRAITTVPAALLGIPNVARVGQGMAATFVAMTGPIFDEGTEISHTFVEGGYEKGSSGGGGDAPAVVITGEWEITFGGQGQEFPFTMELKMDPDGSFDGSASSDFGTADVKGRVAGNTIEFTMTLEFGGQSIEMNAEGTVEGSNMSGNGEGPFGPFEFSGTKVPGGVR